MRSLFVSLARHWCFRVAPLFIALVCVGGLLISCTGKSTATVTNGLGTVNVSISDPPSCSGSTGTIAHVFITVRSVQAHTSASAAPDEAGWQELAPQLANQPMQVDLFSAVQTTCVLAQLGSAQLPAGDYQQIRLILLSNTPSAGAALPATNQCAGNGFNCAMLSDGTIHELQLSSQDETGLKIPPGQVVGGPIHVAAGQSVDLNIDFNACASILPNFRLRPTLTAGQVSTNNSGISGQIVDATTKKAISGPVLVAIEKTDGGGVDRIMMEAAADANGNFRFCPLPMGTFDIVAVALGPNNLPYNATAVLNVPNGQSLGMIPLTPETGATGPAELAGIVSATTGTAPAQIDVAFAALQAVSVGGAARQLSIPLQNTQATAGSPAQASTSPLSVVSTTACVAGSPPNANCAAYILVVPASNPVTGTFSAAGFSFGAPAAGDVLFTVDAIATKPGGGGGSICTQPEQMTAKDGNGQPLKVTAGMTTKVSELDFLGCS